MAKRKKGHGIFITHMLDDMTTEYSAKAALCFHQILAGIFTVDGKAALPAGSNRLFRMIDPNRFNSLSPKQFQEQAAAATHVQYRPCMAEEFDKARLNLAHYFFIAAELIRLIGFIDFRLYADKNAFLWKANSYNSAASAIATTSMY